MSPAPGLQRRADLLDLDGGGLQPALGGLWAPAGTTVALAATGAAAVTARIFFGDGAADSGAARQ